MKLLIIILFITLTPSTITIEERIPQELQDWMILYGEQHFRQYFKHD